MAFETPTLAENISRAISEINARLTRGATRLAVNVLSVLAHVIAAATTGLYGYLNWLSKQFLYDSAEDEYLERWASIWNIHSKDASHANGNLMGKGTPGSILAAGTLLQRADGVQYRTVAEVRIADEGKGSVKVICLAEGVTGNAEAGQTLTLVTAVAGIASAFAVDDEGITGGTDKEEIESLRERFLDRIRNPPHGGDKQDYVTWAKEVAGVTRAWCYPNEMGLGTVTVRFVRDNDVHGIFPNADRIREVYEHIFEVRPVTAELYVCSPLAQTVDVHISGTSPNTEAVKEAIRAELEDLFFRESEPGAIIPISHLRSAISAAAGEYDHVLESPLENITSEPGYMSVLGEVIFHET